MMMMMMMLWWSSDGDGVCWIWSCLDFVWWVWIVWRNWVVVDCDDCLVRILLLLLLRQTLRLVDFARFFACCAFVFLPGRRIIFLSEQRQLQFNWQVELPNGAEWKSSHEFSTSLTQTRNVPTVRWETDCSTTDTKVHKKDTSFKTPEEKSKQPMIILKDGK